MTPLTLERIREQQNWITKEIKLKPCQRLDVGKWLPCYARVRILYNWHILNGVQAIEKMFWDNYWVQYHYKENQNSKVQLLVKTPPESLIHVFFHGTEKEYKQIIKHIGG